ncbi:unnamed protein product [Diatraea saccharalis]|uniref:Immunoglobulin I-set domain-containing protein n=1 Tax=Diatraea saccharalis TaxID=40085 RepID=A0A9N9MZQ4_9NEOP|nr:unnamed protein product [Diatraea saccharalis]
MFIILFELGPPTRYKCIIYIALSNFETPVINVFCNLFISRMQLIFFLLFLLMFPTEYKYYRQSTSIEYVIEDMREQDADTYRCVAHNSAGVTTADTHLQLTGDNQNCIYHHHHRHQSNDAHC